MKEKIVQIRRNKVMKAILLISMAFVPFFCFFSLEYFNYAHREKPFEFIWQRFFLDRLNLLVFDMILLFFLLAVIWLIAKRGSIAFGVFGGLSLIIGVINHLKLMLNGDHFFPRDFLMAGDLGQLSSFSSFRLPGMFWWFLIVFLAWLAALIFWDPVLPVKWYFRLPGAAALVTAAVLTFTPTNRAKQILRKVDLLFENAALQTSNYSANGFCGAFMINLCSMQVQEPEEYHKEAVDQILAQYDVVRQTGENFDVLVVLSESFFDVRQLSGVTLSEDPLTNYDRIIKSDRCYSGSVYTTAIGGGTVRPEFDILTGLTTDSLPSGASPYYYVNDDVECYVSNYRDSGYKTVALHLYDKTFYGRNESYPHIGFEEYYGIEDLKNQMEFLYKRGYATDETTLAAMKLLMEQSAEPLFLSTITIQNHQAYKEMESPWITARHETMAYDTLKAVETYANGLYDNDRMLAELVEYIDQRERPTVLLFYGDHLPTLGTNYDAYYTTGYFTKEMTTRERAEKMYSTPFLIYSNRDLNSTMLPAKTGNQASTYYLLEIIAEMTGFRQTPYMNYLRATYTKVPYYNVRIQTELSHEETALKKAMEMITYDRLVGKKYSV